MNDVLDAVLTDLTTEGDQLDAMVAELSGAHWRTPTPAPGWDVATQIAHLAWTDEAVVAAATDKQAWDELVVQAMADPYRFVDSSAVEGAGATPADLLARWRVARSGVTKTLRDHPSGQKLPWFGPPMSPTSMATARFMETWAHSLDVAEALGIGTRPTDRIRHVAHLGVRTRDFAFGVHDEPPPAEEFGVTLVAPSGEVWTWGPPDAAQTVTGSAYDFCLLVTQRRHRADLDLVAVGPDVDRWLDLAQAFAGSSGAGREPRGG
ncbi:MAG: TIGR03084 family metal-binding protein [Actinomycetota bacterium]|nr:TIGR03084 family metal-binding protein [Actinomycetota bacterium]